MKKFLSVTLAIMLIFSLTTCAVAAKADPVAVTISADSAYTAPAKTSAKEVVTALYSMITASKRVLIKESAITELASLSFDFDAGDADSYTIYIDGSGSFYTKQGSSLRKLSGDFYALADACGIGFYKYREIPSAKHGTTKLQASESGYMFKKLDGLFYKTKFESGGDSGVRFDSDKIVTPTFSLEPKSVGVSVSYGNSKQKVWSGKLADAKNFKPSKSGTYYVRYAATFESDYYNGKVTYNSNFSYDAPSTEVSFSVTGAVTAPGEVVVLRAKNIPADGKVTVTTDISFEPSFFRQSNGDMVALLPVSYYTAPGEHYVQLKYGNVTKKFALDTKNKKFVEQYLTVPAETTQATINSQKANDEFEKYIAPIRYVSDNKQYWSGRFIWPLKQTGRRTTAFGAIRYTNGDTKNPSRHGAIDFAAAAGTPVYAPNAGRVLYAGYLQLTGNTVCIEHGYGLKTWYYHMNGLNVKTNDMVKQGQQIGIVGSTGFSTGAHLHYGMSVSNTVSGNVFINPETATITDLLIG